MNKGLNPELNVGDKVVCYHMEGEMSVPPGTKGGGVGTTEAGGDVRSPEGGGGRGSEAAAEDCEPASKAQRF
jgi:hypothetical protein